MKLNFKKGKSKFNDPNKQNFCLTKSNKTII